MKKSLLLAVSLLFSLTTIFAQRVTVPEPEFADQTYLLTSDTTYKLLPRETGVIKTKAGASLYLTGIGKVKTRLTLPGKSSNISIPTGQVRLIIKAANNDTDPSSFINIFRVSRKTQLRPSPLRHIIS